MTDYKHIEHMRNLNDSLIWERMKRCYDYGYEDGFGKAQTDSYVKGYKDGKTEEAEKKAYNRGLNEAWETAKKIALMDTETSENITGYFGLFRIMNNLTASETIAKIKEYEDKQKCKECKKTKDPIFYGYCVGECDYAKPCGDVISREAVYSILNEYHIGEEEIESAMDECQNLTVNGIISDVSLLPSVTQKSGHFIDGVHAMGYREGYKNAQKQKSGKWIPVSERLPEEHLCDDGYVEPSDYVLVWGDHGNYGVSRYWGNRRSKSESPNTHKDWVDLDWVAQKPIAWQPLPKPYEPQESEE